MEKNRLFILISAGVAILGSLLPWASLNAGSFGSFSVNGYQGDGWFVIIAAIVSIVLACLNNMNKTMPKGFTTPLTVGVITFFRYGSSQAEPATRNAPTKATPKSEDIMALMSMP